MDPRPRDPEHDAALLMMDPQSEGPHDSIKETLSSCEFEFSFCNLHQSNSKYKSSLILALRHPSSSSPLNRNDSNSAPDLIQPAPRPVAPHAVSLSPLSSLTPATDRTPTTHSHRSATSARTSGSGTADRGPSANGHSGLESALTLTNIEKQSANGRSPIEDWKKQPRGEEPWNAAGRRSVGSLGGLGSFVGGHGEIVEGRKG